MASGSVSAQWANRPFNYIAVDQDIRQLLRDFAANQGVGIVISDAVQGRISGEFVELPAREFIDKIAAASGLIWYRFGGILYVYDSSESTTEVVNVVNASPEQIRQSLSDLGLIDPRFDWRVDDRLGLVLMTGPPRYIELIKQVAQTVEAREASAPSVAVIRLRHASAVDRLVTYRDQQVTIPGVTSILRQLAGREGGTQIQRRFQNNSAAPVPGLSRGSDTSSGAAPLAVAPATSADPAPQAADSSNTLPTVANPAPGSRVVQIESDARLNAVIIGARAEQIPLYRQLITELDVPTQLIQIDVSILEVATNRLTALGISWQAGDVTFNSSVNDAISSGLQIATSISSAPFNLLADVRALEQDGDARIVSQPSILTFDSVEAIIDESETIYVRVAGDQDVNLFQVQTGTLLRVTPRIVDFDRRRDIELVVEIRDGDFDQQKTVDDIPSVIESTLTTNAIVTESQGLLLGGLYRASTTNTEDSIPVLGDIPILGWAFRSQQVQDTSVIRLFLLTPTVIELSPSLQGVVDLEPLLPPSRSDFLGSSAGLGASGAVAPAPIETVPEQLAGPRAAPGATATETAATTTAALPSPAPRSVPLGRPRQLLLPVPRELEAAGASGVTCGSLNGSALPATIDAARALMQMRCSRSRPSRGVQQAAPLIVDAVPSLY